MNSRKPPADGDRVYGSLNAALNAHRIPIENHVLIHQMVEAIGIARLVDRGTYIRADRIDGSPALNIQYGWTNGFRSRSEAEQATGGAATVWESKRGTGQWGVTHPENRTYSRGPIKNQKSGLEHGVCPNCHMSLAATGECGFCD